MTIETILRELRDRRIRIWAESGRLRCSAPKSALTPELERALGNCKSELLRFLEHANLEAHEPELKRAARTDAMPLSYAQERLWFLDRLQPGQCCNIVAFRELDAEPDEVALERAVAAVVARHEVLRTSFAEDAGVPVARIDDSVTTPFEVIHAAADARAEIERLSQCCLPLTRAPLLRTYLVRHHHTRPIFVLIVHHIVSDGWSVGVLFRELTFAYEAFARGDAPAWRPPAAQYADYVAWQRAQVEGDGLAAALGYWQQKLAGCPTTIELPFAGSSALATGAGTAAFSFSLGGPVSAGLRSLCAVEGATSYMVLLGIFNVLLFRYTNQPSVLVGAPVANRVRPELEDLVGLFVNSLVIRTDLDRRQSARSLVRAVRETVLEAHAHAEVPFEKIVEAIRPTRSTSHAPLLQIAFVLQNTPWSAEYETQSGGSTFELVLYAWEDRDSVLRATLEYRKDLFDPVVIARMAEHFTTLAGGFASTPDEPIGRLPLLSSCEKDQVLREWNRTVTAYPRDATIHGLFAEQAACSPDAVAMTEVSAGVLKRSWTYAELDRCSNQLANMLAAEGAGPEVAVAVVLERSAAAVVAFLATLKAGAAYVPLDPAYPAQRLEFLLRDAGVRIVISSERHRQGMPPFAGPSFMLDEESGPSLSGNPGPVESSAGPESMAYVMYTSGSTGEPKGVGVVHRGVVRLVRGADYAAMSPDHAILACAPTTFDASTFEIWSALLNGGRLVIERQRIPTSLSLKRGIADHGVTTLWLTAGLFHQFGDSDPEVFRGLKQLLAGGDVLAAPHVNRVLAVLGDGVLVNGYGPTENTTFTCCHPMPGGTRVERTVPIGRPIANTYAYVLDEDMQPLPWGVVGELYAGGDGLARCYLNSPELTAERFVRDPFSQDPKARLYRTGDLVRHRSDGVLEFLSRTDGQLKIRGFRIEPAEIESAVCRHPAVRDCVVVGVADRPGSKYLACYVVAREAVAELETELRTMLAKTLPNYMIPSVFITLDELPLSENGKVDRKALPEVKRRTMRRVRPRTPLEAELLAIWQSALGWHDLGVTDNYFDQGGHSLLAVKLFDAIERRFGPTPLSMLFEAPTVAQMAARIEEASAWDGWRSLVAIQTEGVRAPLFIVPGVGGNVVGLAGLARALGPDQPVYGLQSLGLDGAQPPSEYVEEIAAHFLREIRSVQPTGPYCLSGFCMGGVIAYEIAQQLRQRGEEIALLALLETWPPHRCTPQNRPALPFRPIAQRFRSAIRRMRALEVSEWPAFVLRKDGGLAGQLFTADDSPERLTVYRRRVELANLKAFERYQLKPYDGSLLLLAATERPVAPDADARLVWLSLAARGATIERIPANDSGDFLKSPHVERVAEILNEALVPLQMTVANP